MQPLVSVIVPVYNSEQYLGKCIDSIVNQTYSNLEIILVNDNSSDRSGEICEEYKKKDHRIIVIHKENGGVTSSRKAGIYASTGAYLAFVDADDWIDENMYENLVRAALQYEADIVTSGEYTESDFDTIIQYDSFPEGLYTLQNMDSIIWKGAIYSEDNKQGFRWGMWNKLFKRETIVENCSSMNDLITRSEDIAIWVAALLDAETVYVLRKAFYHYCKHPITCVRSRDELYFEKFNLWFQYMKNKLSGREGFDELKAQIDRHMTEQIMNGLGFSFPFLGDNKFVRYMFPREFLFPGSRLVIYGAGAVGREYYKQFRDDARYKVVRWVDKKGEKEDEIGIIEEVPSDSYDIIIIAILHREIAMAAKEELKNKGIPESKIVWSEPVKTIDYILGNYLA